MHVAIAVQCSRCWNNLSHDDDFLTMIQVLVTVAVVVIRRQAQAQMVLLQGVDGH